MKQNNELVDIIAKLALAKQRMTKGELAEAFEIIEQIKILLEQRRLNAETGNITAKDHDFYQTLINSYNSLRSTLLKKMAQNL